MKKLRNVKIILLVLVAFVCSSCSVANIFGSSPTMPEVTGVKQWYYFDEVTCESEVLTLGDEHVFFYNCECGEPIGDADIYEKYEYNEDDKTIRIYNEYDDSEMTWNVLEVSKYHLVLEMDGKVKVFTPEYINDGFSYFGGDKYISDYTGYFTVRSLENGSFEFGPFNYDGDIEYGDEAFLSYKAASNVEYGQLDITTNVVQGLEEHDEDYKVLSDKEAAALINGDSTPAAFIWLNDNLEVEKVIFFGQIVIQ